MNFSRFYFVVLLLASGASFSAAQAAPDAHDFGIKIEKPPASKPKTDKPKTAAPKVTAPKATAPKPASVPQAVEVVSVEAARVPLLLRQMEAGQLTPEAAWKSGALTREGLLYLFERHLDVWKLTEANPHRELYLQLAGLLAPQMSEVAKPSRRVRLWLGEFYRVQQDERAAALLESVLDEFKAPVKSKDPVLFLTTERLAWFYRDRSQHEQAAQTWLRLENLASDAHWKADGVMEAARSYIAAGDESKAKELYAQVPQYGHGWSTGLAIYDQAVLLINQSKHKEARQLLNTPFGGQDADQIRVALLSLQALSYYQTGELETANRYAQQAVAQAASMKLPAGKGLEATVNSAEAIQNWSAQWSKAPISIANGNFRIVLAPQESNEKTVTRHLFVRTMRDVPLVAAVDDARIKARVTDNKQENDYFVQKELVIEVPLSLSQSVNATLTVSSPQFPAYQAKIPFNVEVLRLVQLSSSSVFFGEVKANEPTTRKLTLSAAVPFRVLDVKTDTSKLEVQSPVTQVAKEHTLTLSFTSSQVGRFESGTIRIRTDVPNEEMIKVDYFALTR